MTEILNTITNAEDGLSAVIARIPLGYSVALRDDDSGEFAGAKIFPTLAQAEAYAAAVLAGEGAVFAPVA